MKKWNLELELVENEDEFFKTLEYANQHKSLKMFLLDMLKANGFDAGIKLNKYEETYDEEDWDRLPAEKKK